MEKRKDLSKEQLKDTLIMEKTIQNIIKAKSKEDIKKLLIGLTFKQLVLIKTVFKVMEVRTTL